MILASALEQAVASARCSFQQALKENDLEVAQRARDQFSEAACHAVQTGRFMLASSLTSAMWQAFKIERVIQDFRTARISEPLFRLCIHLFPPTASVIRSLDKANTRLEIDLMLIEALIDHDDPQCNVLLHIISDLSYRASHKALAVSLTRFFSTVKTEFIEKKDATPLIRYINEYGRDYPSGKKLPAPLLKILAEHQGLLIQVSKLSESSYADQKSLSLNVLKQLYRTGARDVVNAMAPAWMFNTEQPWSLVDLEAMGFTPKFSILKSKLEYPTGSNLCAAVYALCSANLDTEQFENCLEHFTDKFFKHWMEALAQVCKAIPTAQRNELLTQKIRTLLISVCAMKRMPAGYPQALLEIEGLEHESLLEIPILHETMLCVDLGL
ncbi:hypothetical protein RBE51_20105 [Pseudomonas taiwanensis]|uniref:hypothetical protein n=1 Tax=Pseudomonas taiwanensis TaxID=470150 RepID=UPI0028E091F6|nr:hypothetical protein [Pseudomonas taiwanensis]MDT8925097.1 hypothetical protein [Pseudomonas taiwanensis]